MTEGQLALVRYILEQVKEGKTPSVSNDEKVDLDSTTNYFDNLLLDVEKQKKKGKIKNGEGIAYRLLIEI